MPEAYLLLSDLQATRPGLLVLDADGRRVDSIPLGGAKPAAVAETLRAAAKGPAFERFVLESPDEKTRRDLESREGVRVVGEENGRLTLACAPGALDPRALPGLLHPIALAGVAPSAAGVWYPGFVNRLLLDPARMSAEGVEARVFRIENVSKGALGARVAAAPLAIAGVLTVFPDIDGEEELVVGRAGKVDWAAVRRAFADAGCPATEKPRNDEAD